MCCIFGVWINLSFVFGLPEATEEELASQKRPPPKSTTTTPVKQLSVAKKSKASDGEAWCYCILSPQLSLDEPSIGCIQISSWFFHQMAYNQYQFNQVKIPNPIIETIVN